MPNTKSEGLDESYRNLLESLKQEENEISGFDIFMFLAHMLVAITALGALIYYFILKPHVL